MDLDRAPWGMVLRDITSWDELLGEVMCNVPAVRPGLGRGGRRVDPPMPGGQSLALRVPAADRTDPASVVRDWALKLRRDLRDSVPLHRPMDGEARYMLAHLGELQAAVWASECWRELESAWRSLGEATGQLDSGPEPEPMRSCRDLADRVPDEALVTLSEAERFWPGVSARVRTARSRNRARKVAEIGAGPAQPDGRGRYLVADLRRWHLTPEPQMM